MDKSSNLTQPTLSLMIVRFLTRCGFRSVAMCKFFLIESETDMCWTKMDTQDMEKNISSQCPLLLEVCYQSN